MNTKHNPTRANTQRLAALVRLLDAVAPLPKRA
jgi:hypothetical protein